MTLEEAHKEMLRLQRCNNDLYYSWYIVSGHKDPEVKQINKKEATEHGKERTTNKI